MQYVIGAVCELFNKRMTKNEKFMAKRICVARGRF